MTHDEQVRLVDCDFCGATGQISVDTDGSAPGHWFRVAHGHQMDGIFCSQACLAQWASTPSPTNAELTAIARDAFRKASGAA